MENIIVSIFDVESEGYQALTELRQTPVSSDAVISQAMLVKKEYGTFTVRDSYNISANDDTITGGLIGSFVGILGGPVGVLLGGSFGTLVGMSIDTDDAVQNASLLEQVSNKLPDGSSAIIALAQEVSPAFADAFFSKFRTLVLRFDAAEVAEEIEQAKEIQRKMEKEAKEEMRRQKSEEFRKKAEEKRERIKKHFTDIAEKFKKQ